MYEVLKLAWQVLEITVLIQLMPISTFSNIFFASFPVLARGADAWRSLLERPEER